MALSKSEARCFTDHYASSQAKLLYDSSFITSTNRDGQTVGNPHLSPLTDTLRKHGTEIVTLEPASEYCRIWFFVLGRAARGAAASVTQDKNLPGRPRARKLDAMAGPANREQRGLHPTFLGQHYGRIARCRCKAKATIARSILVFVWHLLADPAARFTDLGAGCYQARIDTDRNSATTSGRSRNSASRSPSRRPDKPYSSRTGLVSLRRAHSHLFISRSLRQFPCSSILATTCTQDNSCT